MADEIKTQKEADSADDIFGPAPAAGKEAPKPKAQADAPAAEKEAPAPSAQADAPAATPKPEPEPAKAPAPQVNLGKLEQTFDAETMIFLEGQPGDKVYIIKSGSVEILKRVPNKPDRVIATMGPGMFFGEMALLDDNPRSAGARAKMKTAVFGMTKDTFLTVIKQRPDFALKILEGLCRRLRKADLEMLEFYQ